MNIYLVSEEKHLIFENSNDSKTINSLPDTKEASFFKLISIIFKNSLLLLKTF